MPSTKKKIVIEKEFKNETISRKKEISSSQKKSEIINTDVDINSNVDIINTDVINTDVWTVDKCYRESVSLISHQLESYNMFIREMIDDIKGTIIHHGTPTNNMTVSFGDVFIDKPKFIEKDQSIIDLYPTLAKNRECTYQTEISIDLFIKRNGELIVQHKKVKLARIPVMVGSELCNLHKKDDETFFKNLECPMMLGGTFIVDGSEKVVVTQERTNFNKPYFFTNQKKAPHYSFYAEVRSSAINGAHTTTTSIGIKDKIISIMIPYVSEPINIGIIYKALGITEEKEIIKYIDEDHRELFSLSLEKSFNIKTKKEAIEFMSNHVKKTSTDDDDDDEDDEIKEMLAKTNATNYIIHILENEIFPHIGNHSEKKIQYISHIINRLLAKDSIEDRDHYANKRLDTVGPQMKTLFYTAFKKLKTSIRSQCEKAVRENKNIDILSTITNNEISNMIKKRFKTGNWSSNMRKQSDKKNGVSQVFDQFNYSASLCNLRKINTSIGTEGNIVDPRRLHPSCWGFICPYETPEGQSVGLVKQLSLGATITVGGADNTFDIITKLSDFIFFEDATKNQNFKTMTIVTLNGNWIGFIEKSKTQSFYSRLKKLKRSMTIGATTEIVLAPDFIKIFTDCGRLVRPVFIVENGKLKITQNEILKIKNHEYKWEDLLNNGFVEMIGTEEQNQGIRIANYPSEVNEEFDYCEIHPSTIFGIGASTVAFPDHTQAPRVSYQAGMSKQAIGTPFLNHQHVMDRNYHVLMYPQRPMVSNKIMQTIGYDDMSNGANAILAIMSRPDNQEDALEISKSAVERGLFASHYYICYRTKCKPETGSSYEIPVKNDCGNFRCHNIDNLDKNGIVHVGSVVKKNDPLICKVQKSINSDKKSDDSVYFNEANFGRVVKVQKGIDAEGYSYVAVKVEIPKVPECGDKFASANGQKGVCGRLVPHEDLPFTQEGIVPDMIMNALAIPSRMTIGQLLECMIGKIACCSDKNPKIKKERFDTHVYPFIGSDNNSNQQEVDIFDKKFSELSKNNSYIRMLMKRMSDMGYDYTCCERMYDGRTGEMMEAHIFIGPIFYQKLKHLVSLKIHARKNGPTQMLTRQPVPGRARDGGLRFGKHFAEKRK